MFIVGTELKFFEVLSLRAGYFRGTKIVIDYNIKDSYTDFTYGFGLAFPLYKLTQGIPLEIKLDFMSKEQPSFIKDIDNWNNMTIYNLMVNWVL